MRQNACASATNACASASECANTTNGASECANTTNGASECASETNACASLYERKRASCNASTCLCYMDDHFLEVKVQRNTILEHVLCLP